ncbi:MAG: hypothetical protein Q8M04_02705 [Pseudomonadota bacterium]|nr:hypothetical protein [Pseudomonadota bacterium]
MKPAPTSATLIAFLVGFLLPVRVLQGFITNTGGGYRGQARSYFGYTDSAAERAPALLFVRGSAFLPW